MPAIRGHYIIFNAFARNVVLKGSTIEQYPPPILYTKKKAATDTRNKIQNKPVDFFAVSMPIFFANIRQINLVWVFIGKQIIIFNKQFILPPLNTGLMTINFYLRFSTLYGQSLFVCGNHELLGYGDESNALPLKYLNDQLWQGTVDLEPSTLNDKLKYYYILRSQNEEDVQEMRDDREIDLQRISRGKLVLFDNWNDTGDINNALLSSAFREVLLAGKVWRNAGVRIHGSSSISHEFRVKAPLLSKDECVFISGAGASLKEWKTTKPLLLSKKGDWWSIKLDLKNAAFPVLYKYGTFSKKNNLAVFEEGNNRMLLVETGADCSVVVHDGFVQHKNYPWKGAGVAIPVFSLRSRKGFGTGEFTDLQLLTDWACKTGLKLIQLLPVNDTTATHSSKDSYPYSAISAFALHPLYLNLEEVAGIANETLIKPLRKKQKQLNELPVLDYAQVMKFKFSVIRELFKAQKENFSRDREYLDFFAINRNWLVPYAAFCFLRDKYGTADFSKWKSLAVYDKQAVQRLVSPAQKQYDEIAVHYFTQFHLFRQLKHATGYAHKHGIIIKGDIPIGISKNSVDAWVNPSLFHLNEQAGAPPDAFTVKGQNWGFPTYNWEKMKEDNFMWWKTRFQQMENFYDAFRIDHILGFFRIWSIPSHSVEGIMGRFVPAKAVQINELFERKISYDRYRYTKPYITETILINLFGDDLPQVKETFFTQGELKEEFNTQRKIEAHFSSTPDSGIKIKQALFDLLSNVIFFEEEGSNGQRFHFRFGMDDTLSYRDLDEYNRLQLKELYLNYFYRRQDGLWRKEALHKLPILKQSTQMLVCGEDLGMVPLCVPIVMKQLGILSLEIQRMPKNAATQFFHPADAPYLSVVSPSTHDMSTIRAWWEEDRAISKKFYNEILGHPGSALMYCEPWINKEILLQHLYSPAMWSIFQLQDILGMSAGLRREDPVEERINLPSDPEHYWNYRFHINLEDLLREKEFNEEFRAAIVSSGR